MGEVNGDFDGRLNANEDERIHEWEIGLPNADDITPLTQLLIPPELLSAFNIKPTPHRTSGEVTQASNDTLSSLRGAGNDDNNHEYDNDSETTKKQRRNDSPNDADSNAAGDAGGDGGGEKAVKRSRLVWTPQLHKRFVDVVEHLGLKNAVPKTIMQLMNVEGLTRENVASHLQKYRLYLKRMQGGEGSSFDNGASNSSLDNNGGVSAVPVMGMMGYNNGFDSNFNHDHIHQQSNNGSHNNNNNNNNNNHHHHHQYSNGMMMMQSGNMYGSVMPYHHSPHVGPSKN